MIYFYFAHSVFYVMQKCVCVYVMKLIFSLNFKYSLGKPFLWLSNKKFTHIFYSFYITYLQFILIYKLKKFLTMCEEWASMSWPQDTIQCWWSSESHWLFLRVVSRCVFLALLCVFYQVKFLVPHIFRTKSLFEHWENMSLFLMNSALQLWGKNV